MPPTTALHTIGFYCGRSGAGFFDEPQNSASNAAFLIGALFAYRKWRKAKEPKSFLLILVLMLAAIGVGSFIFHSHPTPITLYLDLIPIQVYVLSILAYVLNRVLLCSWRSTAAVLISFFLVRQVWIVLMPGGLLGGGATHLPALFALLLLMAILARRGIRLWRYLLAAAGCYLAALAVRSWDVPLCNALPLGLHWAWHILTALAAALVLFGLLHGPGQVLGQDARPEGPA
jgi:hypothetical protein